MMSTAEVMPHDDCCSKHFSRACRAGDVAGVESWTCPACEVEWRASEVSGGMRNWEPIIITEVIRVRG